MHGYQKKTGGLFLLGALVISCSTPPKEHSPVEGITRRAQLDALTIQRPEALQKMAEDVFIYAFPPVLIEVTKARDLAATKAITLNRFIHQRSLPDSAHRNQISPSVDTLESSAWLDLSQGPLVLNIPKSEKRSYHVTFLSAWGELVEGPRSHTTGSEQQELVVMGPDYTGDLPKDLYRVDVPTNTALIRVLTEVRSSGDVAAVRNMQSKLSLRPLNKPSQAFSGVNGFRLDKNESPFQYVAKLSGTEFLQVASRVLKKNPMMVEDTAVLDKLGKLGLAPGEMFDENMFTPQQQTALEAGVRGGLAKVIQEGQIQHGETVNGWTTDYGQGRFANNYLRRASAAYRGLKVDLAEDLLEFKTQADISGEPLSGESRYILRFTKEQLPPVKGFWALTIYNDQQFLVRNELYRFSISSHDSLKFQDDGSLDIYIQNTNPGFQFRQNWLPAPTGKFNLVMRLYGAQDEVLEQRWHMPVIQKAALEGSGLSQR